MEDIKVNKVKENYLRRQAKRLGLHLKKSRAKKWSYDDQCKYQIIDPYYNFIKWGEKFDLSIDDVEEILNKHEEKLKGQK